MSRKGPRPSEPAGRLTWPLRYPGSPRSAPRSSGRASSSLLLGGTVYTFSIIAATFLAGLGIGSAAGAWAARSSSRPGAAPGGLSDGVVLGVAWAAVLLNRAFPYWPIDPALAVGPVVQLPDRSRSASSLRCCRRRASGAPAFRSRLRPRRRPGRTPRVWSAACTRPTRLARSSAHSPFSLADHSCVRHAGRAAAPRSGPPSRRPVHCSSGPPPADASLAVARRARPRWWPWWLAGALAVTSVAPVPPDLIAYGRQIATFRARSYLYRGEGLNSSIAVSESEGGIRNFHVSGKVEASTEVHDMRLQRLLGHMSALMHPEPHSVLIVGFGAGVTAGSFVLHPSVERIVICEIEPLIPRMVAPFFSKENNDVLHDPRVEIVYDDARHYILTTNEKFDVITSDPIHPWVKGAASLYTKEYFELVKAHLNPGGVVTQWVPLYQSIGGVVKSEIATFFDVFPNGTIWSNQYASGGGYDVVMLAKPGAAPDRSGRAAGAARSSRPCPGRCGAERGGVQGRAGPDGDVRGAGARSAALARRRADQHGSQPAAASTSRGWRTTSTTRRSTRTCWRTGVSRRRCSSAPPEWREGLRQLPAPGAEGP